MANHPITRRQLIPIRLSIIWKLFVAAIVIVLLIFDGGHLRGISDNVELYYPMSITEIETAAIAPLFSRTNPSNKTNTEANDDEDSEPIPFLHMFAPTPSPIVPLAQQLSLWHGVVDDAVNANSSMTNQVGSDHVQQETGKIYYYHDLWNFTTHSIHIPNKRPGSRLTSLEILQQVLEDQSQAVETTSKPRSSCFVPNIPKTQSLVESGEPIPQPVLNVGMPKCGSMTLVKFFRCSGYFANHNQGGHCIADAMQRGLQPISGCKHTNGRQVLCQLDVQNPPHSCWFPQTSFLDEIHEEYPNATFIMNFRPVADWIKSAMNWHNIVRRWSRCSHNIPGLIMNSDRLTEEELQNWLCSHVAHIREFVKLYPTHKLIELDLYNTSESSQIMARLFKSNETCWGKHNSNSEISRNETTPVI